MIQESKPDQGEASSYPEINPIEPTDSTPYIQPIIGKLGWDTREKYKGLFGLGTSPNNGVDFHVFLSFDGINFDDDAIDNIWNNGTADKVQQEVDSATAEIPNIESTANEAVSRAESAIAASKVNSDAQIVMNSAVAAAQDGVNSAEAEIQQAVANATSDANNIRADVAQVQNEVDTVKTNLGSVSSKLDTYAKSAATQGHDITIIKQKQGQFEVDYAGTKGDVNQIQADIKGLSDNLKDSEGDIASLQATAKELQASMSDAQGNVSDLQVTAKKYEQTFEDHSDRLSKVEQTASTLTNEFSDQDGRLSKVEQTANGTQQTVSNQQGQINTIKTDANGIHETLTGQDKQIATINVTINGLNSKYEGMNGDLSKLSGTVATNSTQIDQSKKAIALKADQSTVGKLSGEVSYNTAQLKVQADQINARVAKGDLISQFNLEAGHVLIQSNKLFLDANSVVFSGKAFIPAAAITSIDADKINAGVLSGVELRQGNSNGRTIDIKDGNIVISSNDSRSARITFANGGNVTKAFDANGNLETLDQHLILFDFKESDVDSLNPVSYFSVTNTGEIGSGDAKIQFDHSWINGNSWWTKAAGVTFGRTYDGAGGSNDYAEIYAKSFNQNSELSAKTRIEKLDKKEALDKIMQDDMYTYQYKGDVRDGTTKRYASFIIDNVNDVAQYHEPAEFLSANKRGRDDGTQLAYLIAAFQYQQHEIEELKDQLKEKKANE